MTDKAWRKLWLEIAETFDHPCEERLHQRSGFCMQLYDRGYGKLSDKIFKLTLVESYSSWLYPINNWWEPDPVRAFTACFIAEIGEKAFMELAEEK